MLAKMIGDQQNLAWLFIRLAFGLVFMAYGYGHITGMERYIQTHTMSGIPSPDISAPIVAWLEFLGGIAAVLGLFTRYVGGLLAITMIVAIFAARLPFALNPPTAPQGMTQQQPVTDIFGLIHSFPLELSLCLMGVALLLAGAGKSSFDHFLFKGKV
ncbi:DoxX family protein [Candidatus Acetothermia bacterium]|nr:DoxX family protein [Candidatus Acetothermia bacterium]MBI3643889.1 DoxX family protein [Candidatus Acetothermia bacterium]